MLDLPSATGESGGGVWVYAFGAVAILVAAYGVLTLAQKFSRRGWGRRDPCPRCGQSLSGSEGRCRVCGHKIGAE